MTCTPSIGILKKEWHEAQRYGVSSGLPRRRPPMDQSKGYRPMPASRRCNVISSCLGSCRRIARRRTRRSFSVVTVTSLFALRLGRLDLEDLPLLCCLLLVQCVGEGDRVEIKLNDHLLGPAFDPPWLPYKFLAKAFSIPMGTLRLGSNTLRLATADVKSRYCLLSASLSDSMMEPDSWLESNLPATKMRRRSSDSSSSTPRWGYLHRGGASQEMEDDEPVRLNIYDLGKSNTVQSLNGWLKPVGIGAFHCAVQVYGVE